MDVPEIGGRTVLVTGGAGFIGSHIVDALVGANEVRVLDDLSTGDPDHVHDDAELVRGNVCDTETLVRAAEGVDLIFHEAAVVSVERTVHAPVESHAVNASAALDVLECARQEGARVVVASSAAIYGDPERVPVGETDPKRPASPYGVQKLALDEYARVYAELYDVPTVALRYFNAYGPRGVDGEYSGVIGVFLRQARAGEPLTVDGDGSQTRDFVHVSDVVRANLLAATTDRVGEAYNVGTGTATSVADLARTVSRVSGTDSGVVQGSPREGDVQDSVADLSKARTGLGYEPTVDLETGLADLADFASE